LRPGAMAGRATSLAGEAGMGKVFAELDDDLRAFIAGQRMFFVATAPLSVGGHVNLSPKGLDTFRVLGPTTVAYLDLTGSEVETVAHLRENGRLTVMFCALEGRPRVLRLYGRRALLHAVLWRMGSAGEVGGVSELSAHGRPPRPSASSSARPAATVKRNARRSPANLARTPRADCTTARRSPRSPAGRTQRRADLRPFGRLLPARQRINRQRRATNKYRVSTPVPPCDNAADRPPPARVAGRGGCAGGPGPREPGARGRARTAEQTGDVSWGSG
jgi:hypothetical protein